MSDFVVDELSKTVGDKTVFQNISFIIHKYDRIGIIGLNGSGKTTLLDVISGRLGFDGDTCPFSSHNHYKIAYLTQEPDFDEEKTVLDTVLSSDLPEMRLIREYETLMADYQDSYQVRLEKIMAEMDALDVWTIESEVKTVLSMLGLSDLSQKVKNLSGGLRRRVQLAQVLLNTADLLLLDEPTNHLDMDTIAWLSHYLKSSRKTLLFITHDRYFLDSLATRIFELDKAALLEYQGNYQDYVRLRAERDEREAALLHKKRQLYKQELAWMKKQPQARATKQQARINRFNDLKTDLAGSSSSSNLEINFQTSRIGKKVVQFEHVNFAYPNKPILNDFNLLIQNKDRIGIVGENGVGKSTLLNLISGSLQPKAGKIDIGETVRIGYFSQQIQGMDESKRLIHYLQETADKVKTDSGNISVSEMLEQFLFPPSMHGTQIAKLSGGEKKRLYLLKILIEQPNVLLLDEPTNDLDIATLTVLESFLQDFVGPVITVSHDRYFLDKMANKIIAFEEDTIREFFGNYTDYLDEKTFEIEKANKVQKKEAPKRAKEKTKDKSMSYFEKKEWATIEDDIAQLEEQIVKIEEDMQMSAFDYSKLSKLQEELDLKNDELLMKYERYDYLSDLENSKNK
ncbi:ABC-F family ATP-binding cassette domain-containing protein [Streptococcus macacae]|uniref:ABC transporter, ATP-binding protein n=1 Tax=Streptococcus macacae NCTC 11558 TaxID=764298 RepID=G5JU16_9STRE|nr:ABC-F family ATP-binding cassette domain-containing protein [Streptococcus macacae]EHJ52621.1 ABC transporter, ATP-binding protein [Streptococcus macacae NCTC 11558]SUN78383.1 ABC transporter ATP-binding protein [Streptococcus macacae NCTC 11558]